MVPRGGAGPAEPRYWWQAMSTIDVIGLCIFVAVIAAYAALFGGKDWPEEMSNSTCARSGGAYLFCCVLNRELYWPLGADAARYG